jgi:hypothetical protein
MEVIIMSRTAPMDRNVRSPTRTDRLEFEGGHDVAEIRVIIRTRIQEISTREEVGISSLDLEIPIHIPSHYKIEFRAFVIAGVFGSRRKRPDCRDAVGTVPRIIVVGNPISIVIDLRAERTRGLDAETQVSVLHILPGKKIHDSVKLVVRRE